jgi:uncharacterized phage protein (TIGR02220 family)
MEIVNFISDLKKMGGQYFNIWLPIILQFHKEKSVTIKLKTPLDVPKTTYYRIINYGVSVFPKYVTLYSLNKNQVGLILSKNEVNNQPKLEQNIQLKPIAKTVQEEEIIVAEPIVEKPKLQRKKSNEISYPNEVYEEIIDFLNQSTGKNYKNNSAMNRKFITTRLNEGFTVDDFKRVIEVKSINWLGNKMEQFLRPETLFSNKFESYLNENVVSDTPNSNLKNTYDQVNLATEFFNSQG